MVFCGRQLPRKTSTEQSQKILNTTKSMPENIFSRQGAIFNNIKRDISTESRTCSVLQVVFRGVNALENKGFP